MVDQKAETQSVTITMEGGSYVLRAAITSILMHALQAEHFTNTAVKVGMAIQNQQSGEMLFIEPRIGPVAYVDSTPPELPDYIRTQHPEELARPILVDIGTLSEAERASIDVSSLVFDRTSVLRRLK